MSARILFSCWPFPGHVFPQMSVATALRDRGHEVAFYTAETARTFVETEGFTLFPFRRVRPSRWESVQAREEEVGGRRQSARVGHQAVRNWLVESIPEQVSDLQEICEEWRPDVIATDLAMWGPIVILWEAMPIPVALSSTMMGPLVPGRDAPPWGFGIAPPRTSTSRLLARVLQGATDVLATGIRKRVDFFRSQHGLPPLGCSVNAFTGRLPLYLVGNIPELDYSREDVPPAVHYVGPCVWHPPEAQNDATWLESIPTDKPWVHVTEGTSHFQDPFVLRAAAQGLAHRPVEAILTTGGSRDSSSLDVGPLAKNIHLTDWISHRELLPRCAALVTTGGPATIMAGLRVGLPLVVVPTTWDKPDNAQRVVEAGVGVRLAPRKCSPEGLRDAVERVLGDPRYADNARRIAGHLAAAPGPARSAELLETLAGGTIRSARTTMESVGVRS